MPDPDDELEEEEVDDTECFKCDPDFDFEEDDDREDDKEEEPDEEA